MLAGHMRCANREMVKQGYAWSLQKNYAALESLARRKKNGLWTDSNPLPPSDFRKALAARLKAEKEKAKNDGDQIYDENFIKKYYLRHGIQEGRQKKVEPKKVKRIPNQYFSTRRQCR